MRRLVAASFVVALSMTASCRDELGGMTLERAFPDSSAQALVRAALRRDEAEARRLVAGGVDPNALGTDEISPLAWVTFKADGDWRKPETLLLVGANPNQPLKNGTPLIAMVAGGKYPDLLELMLKYGRDPNVRKQNGNTLLYEAALAGRELNLQLLLAHGADVNASVAGTAGAPQAAIAAGRFELAQRLLEAGYSNDLQRLGRIAEGAVVRRGTEQCNYKVQFIEALRARGVSFPATHSDANSQPRPYDHCLPKWHPQPWPLLNPSSSR